MDDLMAIMLDVSRLVTCGSEAARLEARHQAQCFAAERERRADANGQGSALQPVAADAEATERTPLPPRRWLKFAFLSR